MMPSYEPETENGSQEVLLQRKGWWARRTVLEKILLSILGVTAMAMMVTGAILVQPGDKGDHVPTGELRGKETQDVCTTPECALAGETFHLLA